MSRRSCGYKTMRSSIWSLPLLITAVVSQSTNCPTDPSCDTTSSPCLGYGDLSIKCPNGTLISYGACYAADFCPSVAANQGNDWIKITVTSINPKQCFAYSASIRQSLLGAYNTWCCQDDNYLKCCPGSSGWPSNVTRSPANCAAMQDYTTDILYMGAAGSAQLSQFFLKLNPRSNSPLCQLLVYPDGGSGGGGAGGSGASTSASSSSNTNSSATAATTATTNAAAVAAASTTTTTAGAAALANTTTKTAAATTTTTTTGTATTTTTTTGTATTTTTTTGTSRAAAATNTTNTAAAASAVSATATTSTAAAVATSTSTTTSRVTSTTVSAASVGTTVGRRRRDVEPAALDPEDAAGSNEDWPAEGIAEPAQLLGDQESRKRRAAASSSVSIALDAGTVRLFVSSADMTNLVVNAVTTASNYTVTVTVTVEQLAAPAATLSPDRQSNSWAIATGTLCGIIAALLVTYLIACAVYKSRNKGSRLPL